MKYIMKFLHFLYDYFFLIFFATLITFITHLPSKWEHKTYDKTFVAETLIAVASINEQYRPWYNILGVELATDQVRDTTVTIKCTSSTTIIQGESRHRSSDIIQKTYECSPGNDVSFTHIGGYILFVQGGHADRWNPHS